MTALAANASRQTRGRVKLNSYPVAASATIYKGSLVMIDATGYLQVATDEATIHIVGVAAEGRDNSSGSDGDVDCEVESDCEFLFTASSITQAMVSTVMVCVDDNTIDDAAGATNDRPVGILTQYVSTTSGWVYIPGITGRLA